MKRTDQELRASMVSTFDTPGKGRKQCPECQTYVGVRSTICKCGNENFKKEVIVGDKSITVYGEPGKGRKQCEKCHKYVGEKQPKSPEYFEAKAIANALGFSGFKYLTYIPSGSCPYKLDKDKITDWIESVVDVGLADGNFYAPSAIKYFGREFYDIHSDEYNKFCESVNKWANDLAGDVIFLKGLLDEI